MTDWPLNARNSLYRTLANLYPMQSDALRISRSTALTIGLIQFDTKAFTTWSSVVEQAKHQSKIDDVLDLALQEYPGEDMLMAIKAGTPPPPVEATAMGQWNGKAFQLEKIIGDKSTLVPIGYMEVGLRRSRSVVRVVRGDGATGTGFMVDGGWLITNHHVLPDKDTTRNGIAQFNYQRTADGLDAQVDPYPIDPASLLTSEADDWSAVKIVGDASAWGRIKWAPQPVKVGDYVNIIQHPGGTHKQISLIANVVAFVGGARVQYLTDTLPGSSGAPVFDADWNLVALHHAGGALTEPNSPDKRTFYRNEGVEIARVIEGLAAAAT